jgi:hypothetical protein
MSTVRGPSRLRAGSQERSAPPSGGRREHTESTEADGGSKHRAIVQPSQALARRSSAEKSTERTIRVSYGRTRTARSGAASADGALNSIPEQT